MAEDAGRMEKQTAAAETVKTAKVPATPVEEAADHQHYEEVAEYRIGEGPPPLPLLILFAFIICWAMISWIPFFGY